MGNANTNNIQISIDTKYSKLENLIKDFRNNIESLKRVKINSYEDFEKCECNQRILNIEMKINEELIKIRNYVLNNSSNINEYTKSNIKLKKYVFDIQEITQEYFEIIKKKTKCFI